MVNPFWNKAIDAVGTGGQFWVFAIAADREMIYKFWDGANWQPSTEGWNSLGADFVSAPSAAARRFTNDPSMVQIDVVGVGMVRNRFGISSTAVLHKFWNGGVWEPSTGWDNLGEISLTTQNQQVNWTSPIAITGYTGLNTVDVVAIDGSGQVNHRYLANGAWQPTAGWEPLGAGAFGAPALAGLDIAPLRFNVFGLGAGTPPAGDIRHQYWDGTAWQPSQTTWEDLGSAADQHSPNGFGAVVAAGMSSDVQFDVFGVSANTWQIRHKSYVRENPSSWQPLQQWETLPLRGLPAAVQSGTPLNRLDLFANDVRVRHCFKPHASGSGFSSVEVLGAGFTATVSIPAPAADCANPAPGNAQLHVASIGNAGMQHKYYDGSNWQPSQTGWNAIGNGLNNTGFSWPDAIV